jgi:sialidase-1
MHPDPTLSGPACAAGLLRYSFATESGQKSCIIFSLPGSLKGRKHGKIWLSYDEGKSWPLQKKIRPGFFAYSCLARLPDGNIGCVYGSRGKRPAREELGPQNVVFVSFSLDWLMDRS